MQKKLRRRSTTSEYLKNAVDEYKKSLRYNPKDMMQDIIYPML